MDGIVEVNDLPLQFDNFFAMDTKEGPSIVCNLSVRSFTSEALSGIKFCNQNIVWFGLHYKLASNISNLYGI